MVAMSKPSAVSGASSRAAKLRMPTRLRAQRSHGVAGGNLDDGDGECLGFLIPLNRDDAKLVNGIGEAALGNWDFQRDGVFLIVLE